MGNLGNEILYFKDGIWNQIEGQAIRVAVDPKGEPWIVN
jgi:hypothetical protein